MILHDKITYQIKVVTGVDPYGAPITTTTNVTAPAEMRMVSSEALLTATTNPGKTTFRLFVNTDWTAANPTVTTFTWRGQTFQIVGGMMPSTIGGRVHHYEALVSHYSG